MMNLETINELIDDLEQSDTSLSNVRNLSALYNVKSHILGTKNYDVITKELSDILPSYLLYINLKKRYQLHEISEEGVYNSMKDLCKEIKEFIQTLFSGTDTDQERTLIKSFVKELNEAF